MANMLLATVAIKNSVDKSMDYAKEKLGAVVYLQPDTETLRAEAEKARKTASESSDATAAPTTFTVPTISETLASSVAKSQYIKDYTYSVVASGNADGFTAVQTAQNEREREFQNSFNNAKNQIQDQVNNFNSERDKFNSEQESSGSSSGEGRRMSGGARPNFNFNFNANFTDPSLSRGDMTVQGINSFNFVSDVENGNMKITSGKAFDESTKNGVVISSQLADGASLKVGSTIKFKTVTDEKELSFTVVGIYTTSTEDFNYNTVYTNIDGAKQFMTADQLSKLSLQNVRYYLNSASDKDAFLAAAAQQFPEIKKTNLKLDIDDTAYKTMVGPIESVGSFAVTILWIVIVAAVAIITLIVVINIKDRQYEMGVLMSVGAKRMSILGQIFIELAAVGTIAFVLSLGTGQLLAQKMGEGLLQQQISSETSKTTDTETGPGEGRGLNAMRRFAPGGQAASSVKQIDKIDVSAGAKEYATIFGLGYLILLVAMVLPSVNILRYQPKSILSGKE
ncbi:ABC transporter permease [Candidatus Saccharibacteria bacterium]|nr:ABC transporter permease [Candidatus Saccharibacteria bacterium]